MDFVTESVICFTCGIITAYIILRIAGATK